MRYTVYAISTDVVALSKACRYIKEQIPYAHNIIYEQLVREEFWLGYEAATPLPGNVTFRLTRTANSEFAALLSIQHHPTQWGRYVKEWKNWEFSSHHTFIPHKMYKKYFPNSNYAPSLSVLCQYPKIDIVETTQDIIDEILKQPANILPLLTTQELTVLSCIAMIAVEVYLPRAETTGDFNSYNYSINTTDSTIRSAYNASAQIQYYQQIFTTNVNTNAGLGTHRHDTS